MSVRSRTLEVVFISFTTFPGYKVGLRKAEPRPDSSSSTLLPVLLSYALGPTPALPSSFFLPGDFISDAQDLRSPPPWLILFECSE